MAIQNPSGPRPGGTASALNVSTPTVIKSTAGTFWNINLAQVGVAPGYLYDANALPLAAGQTAVVGAVYPNPSNVICQITPPLQAVGTSIGNTPVASNSLDLPGAGPFPFNNGLVFIPGVDGMVASIAYA